MVRCGQLSTGNSWIVRPWIYVTGFAICMFVAIGSDGLACWIPPQPCPECKVWSPSQQRCVPRCGCCYNCVVEGEQENCVEKCDLLECKHCVSCACKSFCEGCNTCKNGEGYCEVCGGDLSKSCCDGETCYDPYVKQCCGYGNGKTCGLNEACCDGKTCYDPEEKYCCGYGNGQTCCNEECCANGYCIEPVCENCHPVNFTINECFHGEFDTVCSDSECIENIFSTATCDDKGPDWPCRKTKCDAMVVEGISVTQIVRGSPGCPMGGLPVEYDIGWEGRWGCGCQACYPNIVGVACVTSSCAGPERRRDYVPGKVQCGCD